MFRVLALTWSALTALYSALIAVLILAQPAFPLNLGAIRTTGRMGLLVMAPPALAGVAGAVLTLLHKRTGPLLLGLYSLFWSVVLLAGLPAVWNARASFCTETFCIQTPWISRAALFALAAPFALIVFWSRRELARLGDRRA